MKRKVAAVSTAAALLLTGCSGGNELHPVSAHSFAQYQEANGDEPSAWPLTVDEAKIDCLGRGGLAIVVGGESYWLNGAGESLAEQFDLHDPDPIWADDPNVDGLKVPMDALTEYARVTCGYP